jgi:hypothetical protein
LRLVFQSRFRGELFEPAPSMLAQSAIVYQTFVSISAHAAVSQEGISRPMEGERWL